MATGITSTDMCAVVAIPNSGKVGAFWSNKNFKRFGFKTHNDADVPGVWSIENKEDLIQRIYQDIEDFNKEPVIFKWKYKMEEVQLI